MGVDYRKTSFLYSPFKVDGLEERVYVLKEGEVQTVNHETGEVYLMRRVDRAKRAMHDGRRYTKLYAGALDRLVGLSKGSYILLFYIMGRAVAGKDTIFITQEDVMEWSGMGDRMWYNALWELLDKKIIARRLGSRIEFFFDVNLFFNGDRRRLVKDSLGIRMGEIRKENQQSTPSQI